MCMRHNVRTHDATIVWHSQHAHGEDEDPYTLLYPDVSHFCSTSGNNFARLVLL